MFLHKLGLSYLAVHLAKVMWRSLLLTIALSSAAVSAQEREWWFDIEVILFKRNISPENVAEQFPAQLNHAQDRALVDILSRHLYPDLTPWFSALPQCFSPLAKKPELTFQFAPLPELEFAPLNLELQLDAADSEMDSSIPDSDSNTAAVELGLTDVENALSSERQLEDGSYFSATHLELALPGLTTGPITLPPQLLCKYSDDELYRPFLSKVPTTVASRDFPLSRDPQLLNLNNLEMQALFRDIRRQRDLTAMLHMGWRQQVFFGQQNSTPLRVFAGQNFAKQFAKDGRRIAMPNSADISNDQSAAQFAEQQELPLVDTGIENDNVPLEIDLIDKIRMAIYNQVPIKELTQDSTQLLPEVEQNPLPYNGVFDELWELEGSINVFLRYIQRTPYLHIDSQFDFRSPVFDATETKSTSIEPSVREASHLQSFPFDQLRRVISQQIHYFDHPMFGMIIQIRRYDFPESEQNTDAPGTE
ncbi:peptidoglycan binding protein CsiV [Aliiglaciecola litoralis]|uniref:Peptidoglycan binding protein CsiV n=2 Tax=Aliiglaciecola litoralis TaxID=582857 RepID=A0ABP3WZA7_9ALTE